jgi:hypothetical protein
MLCCCVLSLVLCAATVTTTATAVVSRLFSREQRKPWVGHTKLATIANLYLVAFVRLEGDCDDWNADHLHCILCHATQAQGNYTFLWRVSVVEHHFDVMLRYCGCTFRLSRHDHPFLRDTAIHSWMN